MIRINLVAPEKPTHQKKRAASAPSAPGATTFYLFMILCLGASLVLCGGGWYWRSSEIARVDRETAAAQKRKAELQVIKDQVDALEAKRRMFQDKVDLIERLRLEQGGPVHMLDEVSKALPDLVWLTKLDESSNGAVRMSGSSSGLNAVADFMTNLQRSGWFPTVEMGPTKESKLGGAVVDFSLTATFKDPKVAKLEAEAAKENAARQAADAKAAPARRRRR